MNIDTVLLKKQITDMRNDILNKKSEGLHDKYSYLFTKTPSIFHLIKDNEINYTAMLDYLISNVEEINNSEEKDISTDLKHQEVNEVLAETYIYPVVGRPEDQASSSN